MATRRRKSGKRTRPVQVTLDHALVATLDDAAARADVSRSELLRQLIQRWAAQPQHDLLAAQADDGHPVERSPARTGSSGAGPGLLDALREEILRLAARHGAANVRVFGSAARGEATQDSDVDFLIDLAPDRSLLDLSALLLDLRDLLGCEVDVLTEASLHPEIRDRVLREAVPL